VVPAPLQLKIEEEKGGGLVGEKDMSWSKQ